MGRPPSDAGQRLVHKLAQLRADRVCAGRKKLGKERHGQLLRRVDPERGAGRAAPRQLARGRRHLTWYGVDDDGKAQSEADSAERGFGVQRPAERLQVKAARKVVTGHITHRARAQQPRAVQFSGRAVRAVKIGGYTQAGGQGPLASIPLAATAITSFTHTGSAQPSPPASHFADNNNVALDQVSLYLAGRVSPWAGGFIQGTYNDVSRAVFLDQADVRPFTTAIELGDTTLRVGISVNNNPTVQDPYNSTYVWGYPFVSSSLAPTPAAQPAIASALSENAIGVTAYAWYEQHLYLEAGGYETVGPTMLRITGHTLGASPFGSTGDIAPYARVAYEWNWGQGQQSAHIGGLFLHSNFNPSTGPLSVDGSSGHNGYTDFALDAGYQ